MTAVKGIAGPAVARAANAETLQMGGGSIQLLLDASATGEALSAHRVCLSQGQLGANPHRHTKMSELFFVLGGSIDVLAGDALLTATAGDFVVVPPGHAHAFAATRGRDADVLVMVTPGAERFDFFRALCRVMRSEASPADREIVMHSQDGLDTFPTESVAWSTR